MKINYKTKSDNDDKRSHDCRIKSSYTFILCKPDAINRHMVGNIISVFRKEQFAIEYMDCCIVTREIIYQHYEHLIKEYGDFFRIRIDEYYVGKIVLPMIISSSKPDLITRMRDIIGVTDPSKSEKGTIRGDWGTDTAIKAAAENRCCYNLIHAADSFESFCREVKIWFSDLPKDVVHTWGQNNVEPE